MNARRLIVVLVLHAIVFAVLVHVAVVTVIARADSAFRDLEESQFRLAIQTERLSEICDTLEQSAFYREAKPCEPNSLH